MTSCQCNEEGEWVTHSCHADMVSNGASDAANTVVLINVPGTCKTRSRSDRCRICYVKLYLAMSYPDLQEYNGPRHGLAVFNPRCNLSLEEGWCVVFIQLINFAAF